MAPRRYVRLLCHPRRTYRARRSVLAVVTQARTSFVPAPASGAVVRAPSGACGARPAPNGESFELACNPSNLEISPHQTGGSFAELGLPSTLAAALAARGITTAPYIQAHTLPSGLAGRDVLGRAETGSGKTWPSGCRC